MIKKLGIVLALVFVLCFGSLVFAQNSNVHPMMSDNMSSTKSKRRRHHRRHRRHGRRSRARKTGGNTNS